VVGDLDHLFAIWEKIPAEHPTDGLAFRLAHYKYFWTGRARDMLTSVERIAPKWSRELPGYGTMPGCRCFALEERGDYADAEPGGRRSIPIPPTYGLRMPLPMSWKCRAANVMGSSGWIKM
jgi:hypothetical protein